MKLPFGIKSAPEIFRRAMDEMLESIDHPFAIMDDILVTGRDIAHHDSVLVKVLDQAKRFNDKKTSNSHGLNSTTQPSRKLRNLWSTTPFSSTTIATHKSPYNGAGLI